MSIVSFLGNAISEGLGDDIQAFGDKIGLNGGGGGESGQSSNYLNGMRTSGIGRSAMGAAPTAAPMAAPGFNALGEGNSMNLTPQQWDEMARQAGYRDANQMRDWQARQNENKAAAQQQKQSLPQIILDKIGEGVRNVLGMHPSALINRATDGLRRVNGSDWGD